MRAARRRGAAAHRHRAGRLSSRFRRRDRRRHRSRGATPSQRPDRSGAAPGGDRLGRAGFSNGRQSVAAWRRGRLDLPAPAGCRRSRAARPGTRRRGRRRVGRARPSDRRGAACHLIRPVGRAGAPGPDRGTTPLWRSGRRCAGLRTMPGGPRGPARHRPECSNRRGLRGGAGRAGQQVRCAAAVDHFHVRGARGRAGSPRGGTGQPWVGHCGRTRGRRQIEAGRAGGGARRLRRPPALGLGRPGAAGHPGRSYRRTRSRSGDRNGRRLHSAGYYSS